MVYPPLLLRRAALVAGLAATTVLAQASAADTPPPAQPHTLSEKALRADLAKTEARSADLLEKATQDWRIPLIDLYRSWTDPDQFVNPRRKVTAKLLVAWMADEAAPPLVREKAHDALLDSTARSLNPDLAHSDKGRGKRAPFCLENLVPLLGNKTSDVTRRYAADILDGWWYSSSPDIRRYNPQDPSTWKPAMDMYKKILGAR